MGLVPTPEHSWAVTSVDAAAEVAFRYLDMASLERMAVEAAFDPVPVDLPLPAPQPDAPAEGARPVIGIIRDSAFQFYYPDNIEALRDAGAEVVFMSAFDVGSFPAVDGLYIGGGFPETHAERLEGNAGFMAGLKARAEAGMPVYAECGGLMYLGEALVVGGRKYAMAGVLPVVFGLSERPQGLGYTLVRVEAENPYYDVGAEIRGHEFRYSRVLEWHGDERDLIFSMQRGTGFVNGRDGIRYKNVLATYTHIHALGLPNWAKSMVAAAAASKRARFPR
jgi:cobyrinic acid a,c-diamide synthase